MRFEIPEPCGERWDAMRPTREGRFCDHCQHGVVDLSRMSRREAERRIDAVDGDSLCVRMAVDPTGAAIFRPEPKRAPHWAGGLVLVAALTAGGCDRSGPEPAATVQVEPCELETIEGPPMMPVDDAALTPLDAAATGPVPSEVVDEDGRPTAEQRELTRQKQEQLRPPIRHLAGRMPIRRP